MNKLCSEAVFVKWKKNWPALKKEPTNLEVSNNIVNWEGNYTITTLILST